jgi:hypothetical protein
MNEKFSVSVILNIVLSNFLFSKLIATISLQINKNKNNDLSYYKKNTFRALV